jgi:pimeloyl-ACP methyl ester carboxylesterase
VLEKTEHGWTDSGTEEFVLQLVEAALRTWKLDRNRVFFSGHSMGGYGTWTLGAHHADRVAGLAASAGAPTPIFGPSKGVEGIAEGVIPSLRNVRLVCFQSDDDPRVPPEVNRFASQELARAKERWGGFDFEYWEVSGNAHDLPPGGMDALLAKIDKRTRDTRPTRIVWQPAVSWKRQFYWLHWQRPRTRAIVEADVERAKNEVRVRCEGEVRGLDVLLDDRLVDMSKEVVVKLNDAEVFRGRPQPSLATIARTALSGDPELVFACRVPLAP